MVQAMKMRGKLLNQVMSKTFVAYNGATARKLVQEGYFSSNTCIPLSLSTDGFQAWRHRGFECWPIIATNLSVDPSTRVHIVSRLVFRVTPGPREPVDVESLLHPIADELNTLAAGVRDVTVAGCTEPQVLHAVIIQFTTDMPAGDELINAIGGNGENPRRFRLFSGVWQQTRYDFPPYAPDDQPPSKRHCFDVMGRSTPRRTVSSIAMGVKKVENARTAGKSKSAVPMIARQEAFEGYSLFFCPSPGDTERYPALRYPWDIGPDLVPYDTMHLYFCNVVPGLWGLFCGDNDKLGEDQPWVMSSAACQAIGRERKAGRPTVPLSQARSLQNINRHSSSFKVVFSTHVYAGKERRLRPCRPTIVALLDDAANLRSCGPAWSYWQFPAERLIGTLSRLIRSRRFPYAALTNAITSKYTAELVTSHAEGHLAQAWAAATGKPVRRGSQDPIGTFSLLKEPKVDLLRRRQSVAALLGQELARMQAVLALEGASVVPDKILVKMYVRLRLAHGQSAGTVSTSYELDDRRRDYLVRVRSHVRRATRRGQGEDRALTKMYGTAHHYAAVLIDGAPKALAYLQCVKSSADRCGAFWQPEKRRATECLSSLGGDMRYLNVEAIDAVVGTHFVRDRYAVLYTREAFST